MNDHHRRLMTLYGLSADEARDFDGRRCTNHCIREQSRFVVCLEDGTTQPCALCDGRGYIARSVLRPIAREVSR